MSDSSALSEAIPDAHRLARPLAPLAMLVATASFASAQMVGFTDVFGGFESGLTGWSIDVDDADNDTIGIALSSIGATEGVQTLAVETGPTFGRDLRYEADSFDPVFNSFLQAGADPTRWSVDFDVTFTANSWANVPDVGTFFGIGTVANSDGGFAQTFNNAFAPVGQASVQSISVPVTDLLYSANSGFYQFGINTNSDHTPGLGGEGVTYYLDNVRLTFNGDPAVFVEDQLFSWETPDNPSTPSVNEQLEGWEAGFQPGHNLSITSDFVTDGSSALRIDTAASPPGFIWGSSFVLDATEEDGDPALQPEVTSIINRFNNADKLAFDVTAPEGQFPNFPSFLQNFVHISDDSGAFYQAQLTPDLSLTGDETLTLEVDLEDIVAFGDTATVADGLNASGSFFRITIGSNSDDNAGFVIDNVRLLREVIIGQTGDYNGDGVVNAADYTVYRDNVGDDGSALLNRDPAQTGVVGPGDYTAWANNFGMSASSTASAVPEPTAVAAALLLMTLAAGRRRQTT